MLDRPDSDPAFFLLLMVVGYLCITHLREFIHKIRFKNDPFYRRQMKEDSRTIVHR